MVVGRSRWAASCERPETTGSRRNEDDQMADAMGNNSDRERFTEAARLGKVSPTCSRSASSATSSTERALRIEAHNLPEQEEVGEFEQLRRLPLTNPLAPRLLLLQASPPPPTHGKRHVYSGSP